MGEPNGKKGAADLKKGVSTDMGIVSFFLTFSLGTCYQDEAS